MKLSKELKLDSIENPKMILGKFELTSKIRTNHGSAEKMSSQIHFDKRLALLLVRPRARMRSPELIVAIKASREFKTNAS